MFEEVMKAVVVKGDEKCICDGPFVKGEGAVQLSVEVPAVLTTLKVKRLFHLGCAEEFAKVLFKRIGEARGL
jgi:hypothetical protein